MHPRVITNFQDDSHSSEWGTHVSKYTNENEFLSMKKGSLENHRKQESVRTKLYDLQR
jgi:hypothetical protein